MHVLRIASSAVAGPLARAALPAALTLLMAGALLTPPAPLDAQDGPVQLNGRHAIRLDFGLMNITASVSTNTSPGAQVSTSAQIGSHIGYRYWFLEHWALALDAGVMSVDTEVSAGASGTSVVSTASTTFLVGVRTQPVGLAFAEKFRPWGEFAGGAYAASTSSVTAWPPGVDAGTQTVPGARFGIGIDWVVSRYIALSLAGRYDWLADFDEPIAGRTNLSSLSGEFGFSVLLGGG